jgi:eukaryotic-like serine/threonine-protein kinase
LTIDIESALNALTMGRFEAGEMGTTGVLVPGWMLGRYQIVRLLSVGGMAEIYLARAAGIAGFEKRVVIKRMLPRLATDQAFIDMFLGEARLAAKLDHPNITQVHDIGEATGDYYYAMEYVPGCDLRGILHEECRHGRMVPIAIAVAIGRGICAGLEHAHGLAGSDGALLGIVHRDVSPSNVLVSRDGSVKVTDFGVAKVAVDGTRTRAGFLKGKLGYMSPEQVCSEPLDRRSDVFCIGIVLWELLAGRRLFSGEGEFAVLQRIVHDPVPAPSTIRSDVPAALEAVVMRALHRDRTLRFQTARDMQRELEAFTRQARLATSDLAIGEYMRRLFPSEVPQTQIIEDPFVEEEVQIEVDLADPAQPTRAGRPSAPAPAATAGRTGAAARRTLGGLLFAAVMVIVLTALLLIRLGDGTPSRYAPPPSATPRAAAMPAAAPPAAPPAPVALPIQSPQVSKSPLPSDRPQAESVSAGRRIRPLRPVAHETSADRTHRPEYRTDRTDPTAAAIEPPAAPPPTAPAPTAVAIAPLAGLPIDPPPPRRVPPPRPPPPAGSLDAIPSIRSVEVRGSLQGSVVRRTIEHALGRYRACYRRAARDAARTSAATLRLDLQIDESGMVGAVAVGSAPLPGLGRCVEAATARLRSPITPDVGVAHATLLLGFEPVAP